jgi:hypothetical protein
MGRSISVSETARLPIAGSALNDVGGKVDSGINVIGESGDEFGEWSESDDVSDAVVIGDDSADSEFWVDVLSWCL